MTRPLQFIPFKSRSDKGWAEAWELYEKSFPYNERWNAEGYDRAFGDPNFEADGIWRGDEFIGILFHWGADGYRYVEHLAVSPALRGQNMGSAALSAFCRKVGRVILEIDPPVDDISIRRLHISERLGFVADPCRYIHPSVREPITPHRHEAPTLPNLAEKADRFQQDNGSDRHRPFSGGISFPASPAMQTMQADRRHIGIKWSRAQKRDPSGSRPAENPVTGSRPGIW